ncbi:MAG: ABC transporter substrate-binding protein [Oscillospiraceae bacterium]|nr:ABC transporter substrate-binding protein [Oscillospiraceae bacterium]
MKKIIALLLAVCCVGAVMAGCGSGSSAGTNGEVTVCNWGEYIDEDVLDQFEEETGIKVNYTYFNSNETLYSTLNTGGASYDVIIPSDYMISRLIDEGMLEQLDFANIPNYALIDDQYKGLEYDPDELYSVPYMGGTVGIIYNTTMIEDEITGWSALFDPRYEGDILMFDNPRDALGIALLYLGYSLNTESEAELNEAYALLEQQKPLVQAYVMDQIFDKLESGEAAIGPYYAGDYLTMIENNPDLAFVVPEEGTNQFVDAMCIPKGSENKANAEAFINFMCETDVCLANMDMIGYTSANAEACEIYAQELDEEAAAIMFPSEEVINRCEVFKNLSPEALAMYDALWTKLKSGA